MGRAEEALPLVERAVSLAPENVRVLCTLGRTLLSLGRTQDAKTALDKAIARVRAGAVYVLDVQVRPEYVGAALVDMS